MGETPIINKEDYTNINLDDTTISEKEKKFLISILNLLDSCHLTFPQMKDENFEGIKDDIFMY